MDQNGKRHLPRCIEPARQPAVRSGSKELHRPEAGGNTNIAGLGRGIEVIKMTSTIQNAIVKACTILHRTFQLVKSFKIECVNRDRVDLILHLISVPSESMQLKLTQRNRA